jgi:UDP-4-amino-4,6-dideoxy-N-acetyl-beta-L-altrosamine N-acetyltransferase
MLSTLNCRVRPMLESDLEQVLSWRNHPDIRRYMYTQHEITLAEHTHWFNKAVNSLDHHLLVFELDNVALGFVNINNRSDGNIAEWGFYVAPNSEKGTGKRLGITALDYAFNTLKLHKICGQALAHNTPSVKFHMRLGFVQEGVLRDQYFNGQNYEDVIHFGLLADEWKIKETEL